MLELLRVYSLVRVHGDHGCVAYVGMLFNVQRSCRGQISSHVEQKQRRQPHGKMYCTIVSASSVPMFIEDFPNRASLHSTINIVFRLLVCTLHGFRLSTRMAQLQGRLHEMHTMAEHLIIFIISAFFRSQIFFSFFPSLQILNLLRWHGKLLLWIRISSAAVAVAMP